MTGTAAQDCMAEDLQPWLQPYGLIDSDSEAVTAAVAEATLGCTSQEQKAVACYRYVRDRILFGFSAGFGELPLLTFYCALASTLPGWRCVVGSCNARGGGGIMPCSGPSKQHSGAAK